VFIDDLLISVYENLCRIFRNRFFQNSALLYKQMHYNKAVLLARH